MVVGSRIGWITIKQIEEDMKNVELNIPTQGQEKTNKENSH